MVFRSECSIRLLSATREGSPIAEGIDEKFCVGEVEFLGETREKYRHRIRAVAAENGAIQQIYGIKIDRRIQPVPFPIEFDSDFINRDPPRLRRRRVLLAGGQPMGSLPDRTLRAFDTQQA
jgi:hypothetical protein